MDYLSYLTLKATHPGNGQPKGNGPDYIVLNSVSNVGKAIPVLKEYKSALCLLDNDSAGRQAFQQMAQENKTDHQHETAPKLIEKPAKKQSG